MVSGRSSNLSLKYQRFKQSGCKDIGIRKFEFMAKTQFLYFQVTDKTICFISSSSKYKITSMSSFYITDLWVPPNDLILFVIFFFKKKRIKVVFTDF